MKALIHNSPEHSEWFVVNWCLGNTCNFSCTYCPAILHDGSNAWPELDVIKQSASNELDEAEYKGKSVPLSKPIRTGPSEGGKFKVYVKDPKTGNIKMVRFGDTTGLSIKRDDPKRRKNYRARHHCENPGPKTKANYWSCKMWTAKPVGKILKGK